MQINPESNNIFPMNLSSTRGTITDAQMSVSGNIVSFNLRFTPSETIPQNYTIITGFPLSKDITGGAFAISSTTGVNSLLHINNGSLYLSKPTSGTYSLESGVMHYISGTYQLA